MVDRFLGELDGYLVVSRRYRRRVLGEAADHLTEAAGAKAGGGAEDPVAEAVRRFGAADRLAAEINAGWASGRARRAPGFALLAGAAVVAGAAAGVPTVPASAGPAGQVPVAVVATVAFLALQLAVVAGAVALLRVLARRSAPVLASTDRRLAWRAARLAVAATAVAGAGFIGVAALQAQRSGNGAGRVVAAALGMLAVVVLTAAALRRPRPATDPGPARSASDPEAAFEASGMAGAAGPVERWARLAERAVAITRRWPGPVTTLLAGLCAAGSYAHAESGRPASLLAAVVEATAVVLFARIFGPTLELRDGPPSADPSSARSTVSD